MRFSLAANPTTGYQWAAEWNTSECELSLDYRTPVGNRCGAGGETEVTMTSRIYTPARVELRYARAWETNTPPAKAVRLLVYTVGEAKDARYAKNAVNLALQRECAERGLKIVDLHLHIRGGMTPELALVREKDFFVKSSAMENHGREWEIYDNAKLRAFAARCRAVNPKMPVGIQVNDRDWATQIDAETRAQFDYILADSMIMGTLPSGRANRLWMVTEISEPDKWMEEYFAHVMRILDEPISIYANPTYLPKPIASQYDRLWTEERMRAVIAKANAKGIALEIQAESSFPSDRFLKLAKEMGAKFSFGTNNFDPGPKDLSRWLEVIRLLDLKASDIYTVAGSASEIRLAHETEAYGDILQQQVARVRLWPEFAPGETNACRGRFEFDTRVKAWRRLDVTCPELLVFRPDSLRTKTLLLDLPGGGYCSQHMGHVDCIGRLTLDSGRFFAVLHYRIPRRLGRKIYAAPREDLVRAVRWLRSHASEYGWDPEAIGTVGYSAGAHLSVISAVSSQDDLYAPIDAQDAISPHLNFAVAVYPAYLLDDGATGPNVQRGDGAALLPELKFDPRTPPMLLLHGDDDYYSPMGSVQLYAELHRRKIPAQLMIYSGASHGLNNNVNVRGWKNCILDWLTSRKF